MKQDLLKVSGMTCTACEDRIERALSHMDGVGRTRANRLKNEVVVVFDPARTTSDQLAAAIERAGYVVARPE